MPTNRSTIAPGHGRFRRTGLALLLLAALVGAGVAAAFDAVPGAEAPAAQRTPTAAPTTPAALRVIDGDTLDVDGERIRLFGVDAPEGGQRCSAGEPGPMATAALATLVQGHAISCTRRDRDRYGRSVAICTAGGEDLGAALVRAGWAWNYARYAGDLYAAEEREARDSRRGIWAMGCDSPWAWRAERRRPTQPAR